MKYKAPRGTHDILPDEAIKWQELESRFREFCGLYGFREIRTPIFEQTELFRRSVGEESDIVSKEMYSFQDRSGRDLTLRPELTAAVVRAYLENNLGEKPQPVKLYYNGPMFRYDRPQAGRYRQFHQFGLELFGVEHPAADAEIISFCYHFFKSLQIGKLSIELNSVGCPECRPRYREILMPALKNSEDSLCKACLNRYKTNPLRVLDCKEENCRQVVESLPEMTEYLCSDCERHFSTLRELLNKLEIPFNLNNRLVRGLDYYTRTAFELISDSLGAQASLCGGGRYDHLVEHCGGPPTPGVGVAFGVERIILTMDWEKLIPENRVSLYIASAGENMEGDTLLLADQLRRHGVGAETEMLGRSLKAQLKYAGKKGFQKVVIIGEDEISRGIVILRDMEKGTQEELPLQSLTGMLTGIELSAETALSLTVNESSPGTLDITETELKSHDCGMLNQDHIDTGVKLAGWVSRRRDHGGLIFIDLRDRSGLVQLLFDQQLSAQLFKEAETLRNEFVIAVEGHVARRSPENINPNLPTGQIEISVSKMEILNKSKTPPFYIEDNIKVDEDLRLRYRYIDLRRPEMFGRLQMRHRAVKLVRDYMDRYRFLEIETPILTRSTPEGARDFLVPSRVHPGSFYALPQSPQLFKQLLMISGVERYFQIVRCFRDEDLRADRQPEFTQIDIETAFFGKDDLFALIEGLIAMLWKEIKGLDIDMPFLRITYREAMERFGSDKPDLRFGMELIDISEMAQDSSFTVFKKTLEENGCVKGIRIPGGQSLSRKNLDDLTETVRQLGAAGLAWLFKEESGWRSPIAKYFSTELLNRIGSKMAAEPGDLLLFVADQWEKCCQVLGYLRCHLSADNVPAVNKFLWVVDFPLFNYDREEQRYDPIHHPFTAPLVEDISLMDSDPLAVRAQAYDLVLNGVEIGGGSNRIHDSSAQLKIFKLLGLSAEEIQEKFGFLLEALSYGAPPHCGIALGLDRIIALLAGDENIRQVIPFPKTTAANCLMTGAPSSVSRKQLDDLKIKLIRG